jgi:hypothetical protein
MTPASIFGCKQQFPTIDVISHEIEPETSVMNTADAIAPVNLQAKKPPGS